MWDFESAKLPSPPGSQLIVYANSAVCARR